MHTFSLHISNFRVLHKYPAAKKSSIHRTNLLIGICKYWELITFFSKICSRLLVPSKVVVGIALLLLLNFPMRSKNISKLWRSVTQDLSQSFS